MMMMANKRSDDYSHAGHDANIVSPFPLIPMLFNELVEAGKHKCSSEGYFKEYLSLLP